MADTYTPLTRAQRQQMERDIAGWTQQHDTLNAPATGPANVFARASMTDAQRRNQLAEYQRLIRIAQRDLQRDTAIAAAPQDYGYAPLAQPAQPAGGNWLAGILGGKQ